jgi:hypothetical protein
MNVTTLLQRQSISVSDFRCSARPGDTPYVERHCSRSISFVRKGSFGCRSRGRFFELVAGSILVGHPGDEYVCSHDHICGDECLSFFLSPELVETIGDQADIWQIGSAPPLPELMVLGELAQAAADGRSDLGLDEVGQLFASRFVEVVSGRRAKPAGHRPGSPPRGGNRPLDRCAFAATDRHGGRHRPGRYQPVPLSAAVLGCARRHPAPISGALAAAPCGAPFGRQ